MDKITTFGLIDEVTGEVFIKNISPDSSFIKTASLDNLEPEVKTFIDNLKPIKGKSYLLISAMGASDYFSSNLNADWFFEHVLKSYHKTFEVYGHNYRHHVNKDPKIADGKVLFSHYNNKMHRVELVTEVDNDKVQDILERLRKGETVATSMACKVSHDECSICGHKATNTKDYCFVPGTLVTMSDGTVKNIEDIEVGDLVLDAFGKETVVIDTLTRSVDEQIFKISHTLNGFDLLVTGGHQILSKSRENTDCYYDTFHTPSCIRGRLEECSTCRKIDSDPYFEEVQNLRIRDGVFSPGINYKTDFDINEELAYVIGLFIAEGSFSKDKDGTKRSIEFSFSTEEQSFVNTISDTLKRFFPTYTLKQYTYPERHVISARLHDRDAAAFFFKHGNEYAHSKKISKELISNSDGLVIEKILKGIFDGDGYISKKGSRLNSASRNLIFQIYHLFTNLKISSYISKTFVPGGPTNRNNIFQQFYINTSPGKQATRSRFVTENGLLQGFIKNIEQIPYSGNVHNLETESNTYVANGISVHNCIHLKMYKNKIHTPSTPVPGAKEWGQKVYAVNVDPKFFDISFVRIPADSTSSVLMKVAEAFIGKSAQEIKTADITKTITLPMIDASLILKVHGKLPKRLLKKIAETHSVPEIMTTMMNMNMFPGKEDFQYMSLVSDGYSKEAEFLYDNKIVFDPNENLDISIFQKIANVNFSDSLSDQLYEFADEIGIGKPVVLSRILTKVAGKDDEHIVRTTPYFMGLGGAYYTYNKALQLANKSKVVNSLVEPELPPAAKTKLTKFLMERPGYFVAGLLGTGYLVNKAEDRVMAKKAALDPSYANKLLLSSLLVSPAVFLLSANSRQKSLDGQKLNGVERTVANHPFISAVTASVALPHLPGLFKKSSLNEYLSYMALNNENEFNTLFNKITIDYVQ